MLGYEQLERVINDDVDVFSIHMNDPSNAPDLWGVEGVEGKRNYYSKHVEGIEFGLFLLQDPIHTKDHSALINVRSAIAEEQSMANQAATEYLREKSKGYRAYAEGLGRVLDRVDQIQRSYGFDEEAATSLPKMG
jgi:hypothetical protein